MGPFWPGVAVLPTEVVAGSAVMHHHAGPCQGPGGPYTHIHMHVHPAIMPSGGRPSLVTAAAAVRGKRQSAVE